jgi:hypothetical protein
MEELWSSDLVAIPDAVHRADRIEVGCGVGEFAAQVLEGARI